MISRQRIYGLNWKTGAMIFFYLYICYSKFKLQNYWSFKNIFALNKAIVHTYVYHDIALLSCDKINLKNIIHTPWTFFYILPKHKISIDLFALFFLYLPEVTTEEFLRTSTPFLDRVRFTVFCPLFIKLQDTINGDPGRKILGKTAIISL